MRLVTYHKTQHFHGLVFRKPCPQIQKLTIEDVSELHSDKFNSDSIHELFFIPQDFQNSTTDTAEQQPILNLDRDELITDFLELPDL